MTAQDIDRLAAEALQVRQKAYAPYSHFLVGAAVLTDQGQIFSGCNVENASYGVSLCAERNAVAAAVAAGHRHFLALAVAGSGIQYVTPCGMCRQVLAEFHIPQVLCVKKTGDYKILQTDDLLPCAFSGSQMGNGVIHE